MYFFNDISLLCQLEPEIYYYNYRKKYGIARMLGHRLINRFKLSWNTIQHQNYRDLKPEPSIN